MDLVELVDCADFAARKHRDQRRKNAAESPYINHPIGVARILAKEADVTDLATLQGALLHDTVEDTDTSFDEIERQFGKEVRDIVADVTDDKSLPKAERKRRQIEHAPVCGPKAKLVKLADKLYNLRDLDQEVPQGWTKERAQEYFRWASQVVQGLRGSSAPLEKSLDELFEKHGVVVET